MSTELANMDSPETQRVLLFQTLSDLKSGINRINDKFDTLSSDVAELKSRQPYYTETLSKINGRIEHLEELSANLKERQNIIYAVAGIVAAVVTGFISLLKNTLHLFQGGGGV